MPFGDICGEEDLFTPEYGSGLSEAKDKVSSIKSAGISALE